MKPLVKLITAAVLPALALGCATAKYIDHNGRDSIVNVGQINTQDWIRVADELTQSLLLSGAIQSVAGKPKVLMIGRIKNNTTQHIDTDSLMKKIRVALNKGGRALTTTAVGLDGPEDESSKAVRELRADDEFNQTTIPGKGNLVSPDYSLSGKIIQNNARARRGLLPTIRQSEFAFQLSLTDLKTGLAVWRRKSSSSSRAPAPPSAGRPGAWPSAKNFPKPQIAVILRVPLGHHYGLAFPLTLTPLRRLRKRVRGQATVPHDSLSWHGEPRAPGHLPRLLGAKTQD